jgi:phosphoribosylglycinamide formyltransferase 1
MPIYLTIPNSVKLLMNSVPPSLISPNSLPKKLISPPLKLGIMASGNGSNFEAVAEAIKNGELAAQIQVLIYNNSSAKAALRAENWGVPSVFLDHRKYKNREEFDQEIVQTLQQHDVEWVIMAGWMRLVTSVLIDAFPDKIINIIRVCCPVLKELMP